MSQALDALRDAQGNRPFETRAHGLVHLERVPIIGAKQALRQQFANSRSDISCSDDALASDCASLANSPAARPAVTRW
jgi:hypothetical protein